MKKIAVTIIAAVVLLGAAIALLWAVPILKVGQVEVHGVNNLPAEQVAADTGIEPGENMLRVDAAAAASRVAESPWVHTVTVARDWPGTITVDITERSAVLYSEEADGTHLIDAGGTPFAIGEPPAQAVAVDAEAALLTAAAEVVAAVDPAIREQVERVEVPAAAEITFVMADGRTIFWGANSNNHDKALAMSTVLGQEGQAWNISNPAMVTVR